MGFPTESGDHFKFALLKTEREYRVERWFFTGIQPQARLKVIETRHVGPRDYVSIPVRVRMVD